MRGRKANNLDKRIVEKYEEGGGGWRARGEGKEDVYAVRDVITGQKSNRHRQFKEK